MLCNLFTCHYLQQEVKRGQRGCVCLCQCDCGGFNIALICKKVYLSALITALSQLTMLHKLFLLYKLGN